MPRRLARSVIIQHGSPSSTAGVCPAELQMLGSLSRLALIISIEIWAMPYMTKKYVLDAHLSGFGPWLFLPQELIIVIKCSIE